MSARELQPCGTDAAYKRHLKAGEEACKPCKAAHNQVQRKRLDAEGGQEARNRNDRIKKHALAELAHRHLAEYQQLIAKYRLAEEPSAVREIGEAA